MGTTPTHTGPTKAAPSMHPPRILIAPQTLVYPSVEEDCLWENTLHALVAQYGAERVVPEHVQQAFDAVCDNNLERIPFHDFLRKVRLAWLWQRPALARGMK
ncbi:hypothetical protein [Desulfovibrio cuneatus]|uniref:hypothetical protein n=1 Tax=Desulfovibrio cuneatus TaxID=159728 RepID=UPI000429AAAC|nr:hypothetical protein [Desulfovibrio cuneatus]